MGVGHDKAAVIGFAMAIRTNGEVRAVYLKPNRVGGVGRTLPAEIEGGLSPSSTSSPATRR
jgi:hypothetical protein